MPIPAIFFIFFNYFIIIIAFKSLPRKNYVIIIFYAEWLRWYRRVLSSQEKSVIGFILLLPCHSCRHTHYSRKHVSHPHCNTNNNGILVRCTSLVTTSLHIACHNNWQIITAHISKAQQVKGEDTKDSPVYVMFCWCNPPPPHPPTPPPPPYTSYYIYHVYFGHIHTIVLADARFFYCTVWRQRHPFCSSSSYNSG